MQPIYPPSEDEPRRRRRVISQGEHIGFDMAFMDSRSSSRPVVADPATSRAGLDQARRKWLHDKQTAYRGEQTSTAAPAATPTQPLRSLADSRAPLEAARQARCARLENAWRGE